MPLGPCLIRQGSPVARIWARHAAFVTTEGSGSARSTKRSLRREGGDTQARAASGGRRGPYSLSIHSTIASTEGTSSTRRRPSVMVTVSIAPPCSCRSLWPDPTPVVNSPTTVSPSSSHSETSSGKTVSTCQSRPASSITHSSHRRKWSSSGIDPGRSKPISTLPAPRNRSVSSSTRTSTAHSTVTRRAGWPAVAEFSDMPESYVRHTTSHSAFRPGCPACFAQRPKSWRKPMKSSSSSSHTGASAFGGTASSSRTSRKFARTPFAKSMSPLQSWTNSPCQ